MAVQYNFLDNSYSFTTYENIKNPKVSINLPLSNEPLNIDWASGISESGVPIAKNLVQPDKLIVNNNEEVSPQQSPIQYTQNSNLNERNKRAMEFFQSKGLSAHAAAGIVGNLIHESSGLNTTIKGDSGKAFGIAQWHPDRQKGLKALAKSRGTDISDFDTQLEYVWQELNSTEKKALDKLLNSKNTQEATMAFMSYERPGNPQFQKRLNYANGLLNG